MQRQPVESEAVNSIGHQETVLEVEFSDGRIVVYARVSPEVHRQFMAAPSATSFFEDKIDESYSQKRVR